MEEKKYLKWYNKVGVWNRRSGRKCRVCISFLICNVVSDKYGRVKSGSCRNIDHGIKIIRRCQ